MNAAPSIVLASTSPYRRQLLERLELSFSTADPNIDERRLPDESPRDSARRLSIAKARAVADRYPNALIIGSDQIALLDGIQLHKPGDHPNAVLQLRSMSGRRVDFHTGVCVYNHRTGALQDRVVDNNVFFRDLDDTEIERYLRRERPYDCAGSAKSEGIGIALIGKISGDDPNALIGLPLIALVEMLRNEGVNII